MVLNPPETISWYPDGHVRVPSATFPVPGVYDITVDIAIICNPRNCPDTTPELETRVVEIGPVNEVVAEPKNRARPLTSKAVVVAFVVEALVANKEEKM